MGFSELLNPRKWVFTASAIFFSPVSQLHLQK